MFSSSTLCLCRIKSKWTTSVFFLLGFFLTNHALAVTQNPKVMMDFKCHQEIGKQYYSDGEVDNTAIDKGPIKVKTVDEKNMHVSIGGSVYLYKSGIAYKDSDGVQRFNMLYVQKSANLLATQTAAILISNSTPLIVHLIFTEPLMGNSRSFVRTSFYNCVFVN